MSVTVTVNGQSGPTISAKTGDQVGVTVGGSGAYAVSVSPAGTPGGQGIQGPQGPPSTTITVGKVETLSPGANATVTSSSSNSGANLTLNFGLPAGQTGAAGANGTTPLFSIGTVSTLAAGSSANVTLTTANGGADVTLDFGIPAGADGAAGNGSVSLSNATPANLGTASAGSSNLAARADHVHTLPSLVSSVNNLTGSLTLAAGSNVTLTANGSTLTLSSSGGGLGANDAVDGGDYVGEILAGITFSLQPQSQTLNGSSTLTVSSVSNGTGLRALSGTIGDVCGSNGTLYAQRIDGNKAGLVYSTDNGSTWDWTNITQSNSSAQYRFGQATTYIQPTGLQNLTVGPEVYVASNGSRSVVVTAITDNVGGFSQSEFQQNWSIVYTADATASLSNATLTDKYFRNVAYWTEAGRWVAQDVAGNIHTSSDGTNWTYRSDALSAAALNRGYYGGMAYIVNGRCVTWNPPGSAYLYSWYSTNGVQWVATEIAFSLTSQAASSTRVVGLSTESTSTTSIVRVTTDGQSWQQATLPVKCGLIRYGAGLFWAFPTTSSTDVLTSADGITWVVRTDSTTSVKFCGGGVSTAAFFPRVDESILGATIGGAALSANLTVSATSGSGGSVAYQWQRSLDAGGTWGNVTNATSTTLALANLTVADNGTRYRALASAVGASTQPSQSATLTITG